MCTGAELLIVSSVAQAGLKLAADSASVRSANTAARSNADSANASAAEQYRAQVLGLLQEEDAAGAEIAKVERDAMVATSSAALAGIESGAGGGALTDKIRDFRQTELTYRTAVSRSLGYRRGATASNLNAIGLEAKNRVVNYRPPYQKPSLLGAGLTILGGATQASLYGAPAAPAVPVVPPSSGFSYSFGLPVRGIV